MRFDVIKQMYLKPKIKRLGKSYKVYMSSRHHQNFYYQQEIWMNTSALRMIDLIAIFHLNATIARDVGPSKSLLRTSAKGKS